MVMIVVMNVGQYGNGYGEDGVLSGRHNCCAQDIIIISDITTLWDCQCQKKYQFHGKTNFNLILKESPLITSYMPRHVD